MNTTTIARVTPPTNRRVRAAAAAALLGLLAGSCHAQLYRNSVASTDYDYITEADPSVFERLDDVGPRLREMADKRPGTHELMKQAFVFEAHFTDRTRVLIVIDAAFGTLDAARVEAMRYVHPLGKLPTVLRHGIDNSLVVHQGGEDFTAFSDRGLIIVYAGNATKRISTHDLEETIFHESVHASWDGAHAQSMAWREAQDKDAGFITEYAAKNPRGEDLAESALFAYTILHHPERFPPEDAQRIREAIPNRIEYIKKLLPPGEPIVTMVEPRALDTPDSNPDTSMPKVNKPDPLAGNAIVPEGCLGDIRLRGILADILSNALRADFSITAAAPELIELHPADARGEPLFRAVVAKYTLDPEKLKASILRHQHANCAHAPVDRAATERLLEDWKP